jgi:hypothetical protein
MKGYRKLSPLCAICDDGYFEQLRRCVECKQPHIATFVLFVLGLILVVFLVVYLFHRFGDLLTTEVSANLKITISWITIMSTINTQFGVRW